jgi:hypothetical protein
MADEGFLDNLKQLDFAGLAGNVGEGLRDEFLGIDDFTRFVKYAGEGNFLKALKSLGTGALELGSTGLLVVPGANIAALAAKGGKLGKLAKLPNVLRPLSLEERLAAKGAQGARSLTSQAPVADVAEMIGKNITLPKRGRLSGMFDEIGYGRGGLLGSAARGAGQLSGLLPASQGPLARGVAGIRAPYLSGRLGALVGRSGRADLGELMMPEETVQDPYLEALAALLNSPYAAY